MIDTHLWQEFLKVSENNKHLNDIGDREKVYHELLEKVVNARFSKEFITYREENTVRDGKVKESNLTFRWELDAMVKSQKKRKKKELKKY